MKPPTLTRRQALALAAALLAAVPAVHAQPSAYPERPIRLLVGYSAGGGVDAMARLLTPRLSTLLGQQVVVENRAGAAGLIAGRGSGAEVGPQFGGEPIQVLALQQRHGIPGTTGTASVGLDKLMELIANFSFLVFGIAIALTGTWMPSQWRNVGLLFALGLLAFPLAYLILMLTGKQPLNTLIKRLPKKIAQNWVSGALGKVENEMSTF